MNCKGYCSRVILAWLSSCLNIALNRAVPASRFCGAWIQSRVETHEGTWPKHDMLEPSAVCMHPSWIEMIFSLGWKEKTIYIYIDYFIGSVSVPLFPRAQCCSFMHRSEGCTESILFVYGVGRAVPATWQHAWILQNIHLLLLYRPWYLNRGLDQRLNRSILMGWNSFEHIGYSQQWAKGTTMEIDVTTVVIFTFKCILKALEAQSPLLVG